MVADPPDGVSDVRHEEVLVGGVGAIPRIGEPEVLPDEEAVAVGGLVEFAVPGLADPVAHHGEVHVAVVTHGGFVLAGTVAQIGL